MLIAPSILSADLYQLNAELEKIETADWIHIDVMDGQFVPNLTFGANIVKDIRPHTEKVLDCHLMVVDPERMIQSYAEAGADYVTIQYEGTKHPHRNIQVIQSLGMKAGLAVNPGTAISTIRPLLSLVDLVLVMTVNPGFGGQSFIEEMVQKIDYLNDYRTSHQLDYLIQVDGGINQETAKKCLEKGTDVFVAGSYIFNSEDPKKQIKSLKDLAN